MAAGSIVALRGGTLGSIQNEDLSNCVSSKHCPASLLDRLLRILYQQIPVQSIYQFLVTFIFIAKDILRRI